VDIVKMLIDKGGADVDRSVPKPRSCPRGSMHAFKPPLHIAASKSHEAGVQVSVA